MTNIYHWHGVTQNGERIQSQQIAVNRQTLCVELQSQGVSVLSIQKKMQFLQNSSSKISRKQLAELTLQLSILCQANVDLTSALSMIIKEEKNVHMQKLMTTIKNNIENGMSFSVSLCQFPQYFDKIYCALIDAGEQSGTLGKMLSQARHYQEHSLALRAKVVKALFYPASVAVVATVITLGMLVFVVPQFENIFHSFGASLPFFTQAVIHISNQVQSHAGKILCSIIIMIISSYYSIKYVERARVWRDKLILRIPFVGRFMVTTFFAHWTQLLATLLSAGLTLVDALQIAGKFISNRVIHAAMLEVIAGVVAGGTFYHALSAHHCFPTRITQMIAVGENTGQLVVMLEKIADSQQMVMNRDIDYLSKWLEPAIMIILALVTGALIIAMYLPVFELGAAL